MWRQHPGQEGEREKRERKKEGERGDVKCEKAQGRAVCSEQARERRRRLAWDCSSEAEGGKGQKKVAGKCLPSPAWPLRV